MSELVAECVSLDEAIAVAMSELEPGGVLTIHGEGCTTDDGEDGKCNCEPLELVVGAEA